MTHRDSNLLLCTKFHLIWFTRSASYAHNCETFNARLLRNGRYGNRMTANMSGT